MKNRVLGLVVGAAVLIGLATVMLVALAEVAEELPAEMTPEIDIDLGLDGATMPAQRLFRQLSMVFGGV